MVMERLERCGVGDAHGEMGGFKRDVGVVVALRLCQKVIQAGDEGCGYG